MQKENVVDVPPGSKGGLGEERLKRIPPKRIASLSRRLLGKTKRLQSLVRKLDELAASLSSKNLTSGQRQLVRGKMIQLEAKVADAQREEYSLNRELNNSVSRNNRLDRVEEKKSKRAKRAVRTVKSLTGKAISLVNNLRTSGGGTVDVSGLQSLAVAGDRKEFRAAMDGVIEKMDQRLYMMVTADPTVHTSIVLHLMNSLAEAGRKNSDGQEGAALVPVMK
jgi:hypothetical protein